MYKVTIINDNQETVIHSPHFNDLKVRTGEIKEGINISSSFTFVITPNNPGYNLIKPLKTLVQVLDIKRNKLVFEGRILSPTETMSENGAYSKAFICEDELGYLNDSVQRHGEYHNISVRNFLQVIVDNHNADVEDDEIDKTFEVGVVEVDSSTSELYRYLGYEPTMESIDDKLISRLGGEVKVRKENGIRYIDYLVEFGELKETEIKLLKNLKSVIKDVDPTEVITRLIPLGMRIESENEEDTDASQARLTIESVNDGKDYIEDPAARQLFGIVAKSMIWDDITQPNNLKTRGQQFLEENNRVKEKYEITALDLFLIGLDPDSFEVGNYHPVKNSIMGIDEILRIIGKTTNIINPNQSSLTFGDRFKTTEEHQHDANKSQERLVDLQSTVERQARSISLIRSEVLNVESNIGDIQELINNADIEGLPDAIDSLEQAISNLNDALDGIPIYDLATHTEDGLMASTDKVKLDALQVYEEATELVAGLMSAGDKEKLNRITVTQNVDLDDILTRLENLEDPE